MSDTPNPPKPSKQASKERLVLPVAAATRFILVGTHYPENLGAAARAMKVMGLTRLTLVGPSRLARPEHPMAVKMAVKSYEVLSQAARVDTLAEALVGVDFSLGTSGRTGLRRVLPLTTAAQELVRRAGAGSRGEGEQLAVVFGNEKTGLSDADLALCDACLRIPMAAAQPSINLAQACQLVAYQLFVTGLAEREGDHRSAPPSC
ncbi:MAG: RNA methyltransferase [Polyangiaceae bacterium]|nr:RNA methyltransferase [Polyangiaceae bacterium]MCW5790786.1 RNA methyltransferase [Polyangiaceae bacterium]